MMMMMMMMRRMITREGCIDKAVGKKKTKSEPATRTAAIRAKRASNRRHDQGEETATPRRPPMENRVDLPWKTA